MRINNFCKIINKSFIYVEVSIKRWYGTAIYIKN